MSTTVETLLAQHRVEKKNLQNQITGMKKQATKSKRKQVNARCQELEDELLRRQEQEIRELKTQLGVISDEDEDELTPEKLLAQLALETEEGVVQESQQQQQQQLLPPPGKKRNRQKDRLSRRQAEQDRIRAEAELEAAQQPDLKQIEQEALTQLCSLAKLSPVDIQPDGHCLFASILDQMRLRHPSDATYALPAPCAHDSSLDNVTVYTLRRWAAQHVRDHRDDFVPYLFDEQTCTLKDVDEYTDTIENTAQWGGEVEILALAQVLKCSISVLMSGRATHKVNQEGSVYPELKLVYYKHGYALGEHYNSLHDAKV
ncbi:LAMI_0F10308g1_1 [Lachancea mirantina]|uniref:LAMI_0F10308g1_1 n=1 Tax=Lachancea mirantina TaxID=1230905 RepID=A0A1G4K1Q6_9SACH|nr:LAMI_0F10308g1_1 [Lachancea mirantina]